MPLTEWVDLDKVLINRIIEITWGESKEEKEISLKTKELVGDIKAWPITNHYATIGTAFDYAMRLRLIEINEGFLPRSYITDSGILVAERGTRGDPKRVLFIDDFKKKWVGGTKSSDLIKDCLVLAKMDSVYRRGEDLGNSEIFSSNDNDILDVENMLSLIKASDWKAERELILNPNFGDSSNYIMGADADIVIDGVLVDIKTTKHLKLIKEYLRQLLGYYILNLREIDVYSVLSLGIYFARYGILHKIDIPMSPALCVKIGGDYQRLGCINKRTGYFQPGSWGVDVWPAIKTSIEIYRKWRKTLVKG